MKQIVISSVAALVILGAAAPGRAANLKEQVKMQVESVGLHPGMPPGMHVCAAQHLRLTAAVENLAEVVLGKIKVAGEAYGADRTLLGTATSSTWKPSLAPSEKAEVDLEFLTVTGSTVEQVTNAESTVIEAPTL